MKRSGFTLLELLVVISIIGVVAVIAIPRVANLRGRAQVAAMKSDLRNLVTVQENYFAQNSKYATDLGSGFRPSAGNDPPVIQLTGDGWTATMTSASAGQLCVVFIGSTPAPPATKEAVPACGSRGGATVTP